MVLGYKEEKGTIRDAASGMDPLFFDDLGFEYPSIPEGILCSIISNSLQPINIMKLSTEFSKGKTNRTDIRGVNHLFQCFTIYCSILYRTVPLAVQTPLISALLRYIDRLFGYSMIYTFESVKTFNFTYHNTRRHASQTPRVGRFGSKR